MANHSASEIPPRWPRDADRRRPPGLSTWLDLWPSASEPLACCPGREGCTRLSPWIGSTCMPPPESCEEAFWPTPRLHALKVERAGRQPADPSPFSFLTPQWTVRRPRRVSSDDSCAASNSPGRSPNPTRNTTIRRGGTPTRKGYKHPPRTPSAEGSRRLSTTPRAKSHNRPDTVNPGRCMAGEAWKQQLGAEGFFS